MRFLFIAVIALWFASIIAGGLGHDADVQLSIHQADAQAKLDEAQRAILTRLESKNDPKASEFVQDWRRAFPVASDDKLQELRVVEQKINNNLSAAGEFTLAAHQHRAAELDAQISAPFGGKFMDGAELGL